MKIRTAEELDAVLADDLAWRKKELSALKLQISSATAHSERQKVLLRAGVAILYAHWEGFVRGAGQAYAEHVSLKRLRYDQLSAPFLALALRKLLRVGGDSNRIAAHQAVVEFFSSQLSSQASLPFKDAVSTEANLSSRVLKEITATLGLAYLAFESKEKLIDESLLANRNRVAHGEYLLVDLARFEELQVAVIGLMDAFYNQVSNAAVARSYERGGSAPAA